MPDLNRVLFDAAGNQLSPAELARGAANILVRQTAASAAGTVVWALRNSGSRTIQIPRIFLQLSFDGTGAATLMRYELLKATGVTSITGGAAVTPSNFKTALSFNSVDCKVLDTGLTLNGASFGGPILTATQGRLTPSATAQSAGSPAYIDLPTLGMGPIELAPNEALVLRVGPTNVAVIGDSVFGSVFLIEK